MMVMQRFNKLRGSSISSSDEQLLTIQEGKEGSQSPLTVNGKNKYALLIDLIVTPSAPPNIS